MMHGLRRSLLFLAMMCLGRKVLGSEIINGKEAKKNSLQYMVSVQLDGRHACGGFLVTRDFVITAAHCDDKHRTMSVVLGTHNIQNVNEKMRYKVTKCKHPSFKNVSSGNDIMLLKLSRSVTLGKSIKVVDLPSPKEIVKVNSKCQVAGWGLTRSGGDAVNMLRVVSVSTVDLEVCRKAWGSIPPKVICAGGYNTDKGVCQGDSGGPLVCNKKAFGVVSYNYKKNCDYPNLPNIYTHVSNFLPWIKEVLNKKKCDVKWVSEK